MTTNLGHTPMRIGRGVWLVWLTQFMVRQKSDRLPKHINRKAENVEKVSPVKQLPFTFKNVSRILGMFREDPLQLVSSNEQWPQNPSVIPLSPGWFTSGFSYLDYERIPKKTWEKMNPLQSSTNKAFEHCPDEPTLRHGAELLRLFSPLALQSAHQTCGKFSAA